jgi:MFS family permease
MTVFIGYVYDIFGRRYTLFLSATLSAMLMFLIPFCSSVYPWLVLVRMALSATYVAPHCHPLITDYIQKNSRGKAIAF